MNRRKAVRTMGAAALGLAAVARDGGAESRAGQEAGEILIRGGRVVNADASRLADVRILGTPSPTSGLISLPAPAPGSSTRQAGSSSPAALIPTPTCRDPSSTI